MVCPFQAKDAGCGRAGVPFFPKPYEETDDDSGGKANWSGDKDAQQWSLRRVRRHDDRPDEPDQERHAPTTSAVPKHQRATSGRPGRNAPKIAPPNPPAIMPIHLHDSTNAPPASRPRTASASSPAMKIVVNEPATMPTIPPTEAAKTRLRSIPLSDMIVDLIMASGLLPNPSNFRRYACKTDAGRCAKKAARCEFDFGYERCC
jgi:hypothetical protein